MITRADGSRQIVGVDNVDGVINGTNNKVFEHDLFAPFGVNNVASFFSQSATTLVYRLAGNWQVSGTMLADTLVGGDGNDTIDGQGGADIMYGGKGDDTYMVDNTSDIVVEAPNAGNDTIISAVNYVLPNNVEILRFIGSAAISGTGNALDNTLIGNSAANKLDGGLGKDLIIGGGGADTLKGGGGSDTFRFADGDTGLGVNRDRITDFEQGIDKIDLSPLLGSQILSWAGQWNGGGSEFGYLSAVGQVKYHFEGGDTVVDLHTNWTLLGGADAQVVLTGHYVLTKSDFVL